MTSAVPAAKIDDSFVPYEYFMSANLSALCYLAAWERGLPIDGGLSYADALRKLRLDYSVASLDRIDRLLDAVRTQHKPRPETFDAEIANTNFLSLLAFYVGEVIGRSRDVEPDWLGLDEALARDPSLRNLAQLTDMRLTCRIPGKAQGDSQIFFPLTSIASRLYVEGDKSVRLTAEMFLRREHCEPPKDGQPLPPRGPAQLTIDYKASLAALSLPERRQALMTRPYWAEEDDLSALFDRDQHLLEHGRIVWAALIQANSLLFEPQYRGGAPGEVLYDPYNRVWDADLASLARVVAALKDTTADDPASRAIGAYLADERQRVFGWDVPARVLPYPLKISTTYFDQLHFPDGMLSMPAFLVLISDAAPGFVKPLPVHLWPRDLVQRWMTASESRIGRRVTADSLRAEAVASMRAPQQQAENDPSPLNLHGPSLLAEGLQHYHGRGVPQSFAKALALWQKGAKLGDAACMVNVGVMCAQGEGVPQDHARALRWFRAAADKGSPQGQLALGKAYLQGHGVRRDAAQARVWLEKAAQQGEEEARDLLGRLSDFEQPGGFLGRLFGSKRS